MNRKELEKIADNIETVFRGDAWHGPSVMEIINSLPADVVNTHHAFSKKTISQIIYHLIAWRKFCLNKLDDNINFSLITDEDNYGNQAIHTKENWPNLVLELKKVQAELIDRLEEFDDSLLEKRVAGEFYDFYKLLTGLIQHDTYHLGMIWVLWD